MPYGKIHEQPPAPGWLEQVAVAIVSAGKAGVA
jgi:hypothetical protein